MKLVTKELGEQDPRRVGLAAQDQQMGETEKLLHLILENIDDLIAVVDLEGRRLYNSPSYERIFGDRLKLRGTDSFADIHPDDREQVRQIFSDTVRTGIGRRAHYRFLLKDGSVRYIESQGNVIKGKDGKPSKIVVASRDVTDEREALESLVASEERFRMAFEGAAVAKALVSIDGRFLKVNKGFCAMMGYTEEELVGMHYLTLTHPEDASHS
ncbi:MAG: PAS domain S-box protein, partial [Bacteroidota bacterium]